MQKLQTLVCATLLGALVSLTACKHDDVTPPDVLRTWTVALNNSGEIPIPAGRTDNGTATLTLYVDNSLKYELTNTLKVGDAATAAHIHSGDAGSNGPVVIDFGTPSGNNFSGTIMLNATQADLLKNNSPAYVNVHSTNFPGGVIRGQVESTLAFAMDIPLVGTNEVPSVTTTATGVATLRMTADKKLYSKIVVTSLEANDTLTLGHIHKAAAGVNGSVIVDLIPAATDFGVLKTFTLTDALYNDVLTSQVYVNVHSKRKPSGIVRGQIR